MRLPALGVSGLDLHATIRRGTTLLRGPAAARAVHQALDHDQARYSHIARGWVIPTSKLNDVLAYAQAHHVVVTTTDQRGCR